MASALTHTLKPLLVGFIGMYCFSDDLPMCIYVHGGYVSVNCYSCLQNTSYTCEGNHCLIQAVLGVWIVILPALGLHVVDDRENFLETMVSGLIPRRQARVVDKVQIPGDLLKAVSGDSGGNEAVSEHLIGGPVVTDLWKAIDYHDYHKAKVGLQFFHRCLPRDLTVCCSKGLCSIPVGPSNDI